MTDPGSNGVLLGMIVDRSSFDDEELSYSLSDSEGPTRRRNGRVRRKLRWKPAAFRSSKRNPSSDESVSVMTSKSNRTSQSVHTFHSTATPVQSNKASEKKRPITRPNYPDTFEGVSTIESEGNLVHSRMTRQDSGLQRSQTLPTTGLDFQTLEESSGDFDPYGFDPFGIGTPPEQSPKPPRRRSRKGVPPPAPLKSLRYPTSPGESPLLMKEPIASPPNLVDSSLSEMSMSLETGLPMLSTFDFETDRRIGFFTADLSPVRSSPVRPSPTSSPIVTPTRPNFTPERRSPAGRPPISPSVKRTLKPPSPISSPEPSFQEANVDLNAPSTPPSSSSISGSFSPKKSDSPTPKPKRKFYRRPMDRTAAKRLSPVPETRHEHSPLAKSASEIIQDLGTARSPSPSSPDGRKSPKSRKQHTGPVDLDDENYLEAERNLRAIHEMAAEHLAHGEYPEALEVFEEILRGQKERYGPRHYRVGTALHNLGIVHLKARQFPEAVLVCKEAVRVRKEALVPNHPDVAVSLAQLGVAHLECREFDQALVAFREALAIRKDFLGPKHPKVGKILNNIGCALYELDELDDAKAAFEEALEIQHESLRSAANVNDSMESNSAPNQVLLSIASTQCNIGSIKLRSGHFEEASIALEEALLIQQSVLGDDHPTVLATIESINQIDGSLFGDCALPLSEMLQSLRSWGKSPDSTDDLKDELIACGNEELQGHKEGPLGLVQSLDLSKPKRWYKRVVEELTNDKQCGNMLQVDDDTSSVRDLAKDNRVEV